MPGVGILGKAFDLLQAYIKESAGTLQWIYNANWGLYVRLTAPGAGTADLDIFFDIFNDPALQTYHGQLAGFKLKYKLSASPSGLTVAAKRVNLGYGDINDPTKIADLPLTANDSTPLTATGHNVEWTFKPIVLDGVNEKVSVQITFTGLPASATLDIYGLWILPYSD